MIFIQLQVHDGQVVAEAQVPPFTEMPPVVVWGARTFAWCRDITPPSGRAAVYREVFSYTIPPGYALDPGRLPDNPTG